MRSLLAAEDKVGGRGKEKGFGERERDAGGADLTSGVELVWMARKVPFREMRLRTRKRNLIAISKCYPWCSHEGRPHKISNLYIFEMLVAKMLKS